MAAGAIALPAAAREQGLISFRLSGGQILIDDVDIVGSRGSAVFDTGAAYNSIMSAVAGAHGLSGGRRQRLATFQGRLEANLFPAVAFSIQGTAFPPSGLLVLPHGVEWESGRLISGAAFQRYGIDFPSRQIVLEPSSGGDGAAGRFSRRMHSLDVGTGRRAPFLIDTGSYTSRITPAVVDHLRAEGAEIERLAWEEGEGGVHPAWVRFAALRTGEAILRRPTFEIGDNVAIGRRRGGVLGLENMMPYNWRFDRSSMPVDFTSNGLDSPPAFVPGMTTVHDAEGALIAKIIVDGPAMRAGLQRGDRLIALNNEAVNVENIGRYLRLVSTAAPNLLNFVAVRLGCRFDVSFQSEEIV